MYVLRLDVSDGAEGDFDQTVVTAGVLPTAPLDLIGRAKEYHVNLAWSAAEGADYYRVLRRLAGESEFVQLGVTEYLAYVDDLPTGSTGADYQVLAVNGFGTAASAIVTVRPAFRTR